MSCKICRNASNNQYYQVKEMMFGTREVFTYFTCSECNCLQLEDSSIDFAKYYPSDNYYSYQEIDEKDIQVSVDDAVFNRLKTQVHGAYFRISGDCSLLRIYTTY